MGKIQNEKSNNSKIVPIALEDQPLSCYKWIAYRKGYNTLYEVAEHFSIKYEELKKAVEKAELSQKKDITGVVKKFRKWDKSFGEEELSVDDIVKITGLSKQTIGKRLTRGWTVERIINTPCRKKNKVEDYKIDGKVYHGLGAVSQAFNISRITLQWRVSKGMSIEEAVFTPIEKCFIDSSFWCMGKKWKNFSELCSEYNLSEATVRDNQRQNPNISLDDIILKLLNKKPYCYVVYGKEYPTKKAIAVAYGVDVSKLYNRMKCTRKYATIEAIIESLKAEENE